MISRISGEVVSKKDGIIAMRTDGGMCYDVMMPAAVINALDRENAFSSKVELVTYHYYQMEKSRAIPVLIGFQNNIEKEFFEKFISVSGVGPKAACRALAEPFSSIAGAIDSGDMSFLTALPGIGQQKARLIIAKLQGKVGKFGLIKDGTPSSGPYSEDVKSEALEVLLQLQYKRNEAEDMIRKALERVPDMKTSEELLNEVYRERSM